MDHPTTQRRGRALGCLVVLAAVGAAPPADFSGRVLDSAGRPVARALVFRMEGPARVEATTDALGRFRLKPATHTGFLFVEAEGFRFHGQVCRGLPPGDIKLARPSERPPARMTTQAPAGTRAERREQARRLLRPLLTGLKEKKDDQRLQVLKLLAMTEPGRVLEELERRPLASDWYDGYVRREAVKALRREAPDEARAVAEAVRDAGFRTACLLDLEEATAEKKARLRLLNAALVNSRGILNDHRLFYLAGISRRLWILGEKKRATALLKEGQAIAKELPTAGFGGYLRAAFAEDLGLIDVPAALALMKGLKDPFEHVRHHGNLAQKLAPHSPAEAQRVLGMVASGYNRDQYALRVCHRMAPADLKRARKLAEAIADPCLRARALGLMAEAIAGKKPRQARALLDEAFAVLEKHARSGKDSFNNYPNAACIGALLLPAAEAIGPEAVPEYLWRALALRAPVVAAAPDDWGMEGRAAGALALAAARYDHAVARVLVEEAVRRRKAMFSRTPHLLAAALIDPKWAAALAREEGGANAQYFQSAVIAMLLAEGDEVHRKAHDALGQWHIDVEDI